jgi:hypothetical protein
MQHVCTQGTKIWLHLLYNAQLPTTAKATHVSCTRLPQTLHHMYMHMHSNVHCTVGNSRTTCPKGGSSSYGSTAATAANLSAPVQRVQHCSASCMHQQKYT